MPLAPLVLVMVLVITAAAVTVGLGALISAAFELPGLGLLSAIPVALVAYVLVRVIGDRVRSAEDRHYDRIEK